jgi:ABC-type antimicrobial peptide transport system permease subunit
MLVGTAVGFAGGAMLTRWISGLLFQVSPADPLALGAAGATLILVALVAALVPARRATRINPLVALRM